MDEGSLIVGNSAPMSQSEKFLKITRINLAFTPNTPVNSTSLFAGRLKQIDKVLGAVFSPGQHAVIYGERGVGKTSLANIIYDLVYQAGKIDYAPARMNCSHGITFAEIWREIFKQLPITRDGDSFHLDDQVPENPNAEEIRGLFAQLDNPTIVIVDEFDRADQITATLMADTIKTLSDRATDTTLVLVGVADSIDQLIEEHESVLRAIVQVQMPRMSHSELLEIIDKGMQKSEMTIEQAVRQKIATLSQGLPHYAHLISKHAAIEAVNDGRTKIDEGDYQKAIKDAVEDQSQTMSKSYQKATHSPKKNIFREVLLACAFATNRYGFFSAKDVRDPLREITKEGYDIQAYIRHLDQFCKETRGPVLEKKGEKRRFQYRFVNPLMEPYVLIKGLADGLVTEEQLITPVSSSEQKQLSLHS